MAETETVGNKVDNDAVPAELNALNRYGFVGRKLNDKQLQDIVQSYAVVIQDQKGIGEDCFYVLGSHFPLERTELDEIAQDYQLRHTCSVERGAPNKK